MAWIVSTRWMAAAMILPAASGCNGFARVVEPAPFDDHMTSDDSAFDVVKLEYDYSVAGVSWTLDGKSVALDQVVPELEKRLKGLDAERMRVIVTHPKRWSSEPNPTFNEVRTWARDRKVSFRERWATSHVRGVTFGKTMK